MHTSEDNSLKKSRLSIQIYPTAASIRLRKPLSRSTGSLEKTKRIKPSLRLVPHSVIPPWLCNKSPQ
jgi:hypothetical protein